MSNMLRPIIEKWGPSVDCAECGTGFPATDMYEHGLCPQCRWHDCARCGQLGKERGVNPVLCLDCWDKDNPPTWVNVYLIGRSYGGPQEGGWWYDWGECVETLNVVNEELAEVVRAVKQHQIDEDLNVGRRTDIGSVLHDGHYVVYLEREKGRSYPAITPRYE